MPCRKSLKNKKNNTKSRGRKQSCRISYNKTSKRVNGKKNMCCTNTKKYNSCGSKNKKRNISCKMKRKCCKTKGGYEENVNDDIYYNDEGDIIDSDDNDNNISYSGTINVSDGKKQRHGEGQFIYKDNIYVEGTWKNDKIISGVITKHTDSDDDDWDPEKEWMKCNIEYNDGEYTYTYLDDATEEDFEYPKQILEKLKIFK